MVIIKGIQNILDYLIYPLQKDYQNIYTFFNFFNQEPINVGHFDFYLFVNGNVHK